MDKFTFKTADGVDVNIEKLSRAFPEVITETMGEDGKIKRVVDFEKLKMILGDSAATDAQEFYEFTWPGKNEAIFEAAKATTKTLRPCPEESKNWDTTQNLYIEGDNLEALKILQEAYLGKVKMIYIDPPYNTGKDFVYRDNFHKSAEEGKADETVRDEETDNNLFQNTESNGRFHSDWCSMIYPRLKLARDLLRDDGVIFISIDDNEVHNLRKICDEIFGESNFIANIVVNGTPKNDPYIISTAHEYCIVYCRNFDKIKDTEYGIYNPIFSDIIQIYDKGKYNYSQIEAELREYYREHNLLDTNISNYKYADKNGVYRIGPIDDPQNSGPKDSRKNPRTGGECTTPASGWRCTLATWNEWISQDLIEFPDDDAKLPAKKTYASNERLDVMPAYFKIQTRKDTDFLKKLFGTQTTIFPNPKPLELIRQFIENCNDPNMLIVDFFAGSGTTLHATMLQNAYDGGKRRCILVQFPEKISVSSRQSSKEKKIAQNAINFLKKESYPLLLSEIGKERIRRVGEKIKAEHATTAPNLDIGFRVLKIDESIMKDVFYSPNETSQDLLSTLESNIKENRTDLDLLFACLVDWGVELSMPLKTESIDGVEIHTISDGDTPALIACFAQNIPESVVRKIAACHPLRAVFRDSSFADSPAKINLTEIFKTYSPETEIKVL